MYCTKCGAEVTGNFCVKCGEPAARRVMPQPEQKTSKNVKTWKLVSGILSIVLCFFVIFQSCAAGIGNALRETGDFSGTMGFIVSMMLMTGGIVSIASRNGGKGANVAIAILYGFGAFFGYIMPGIFRDLVIWATWCLICAVLAIVCAVRVK